MSDQREPEIDYVGALLTLIAQAEEPDDQSVVVRVGPDWYDLMVAQLGRDPNQDDVGLGVRVERAPDLRPCRAIVSYDRTGLVRNVVVTDLVD